MHSKVGRHFTAAAVAATQDWGFLLMMKKVGKFFFGGDDSWGDARRKVY